MAVPVNSLISPDAPWYSAPWTWDQGHAPALSGTWGINDFFNWYRYGGGDEVNLEDIGLLERFKIYTGAYSFQYRMMLKAQELAREAVAEQASQKVFTQLYNLEYDLAANWIDMGGKIATNDALVVLGNSQLFTASVSITVYPMAD